MTFLLILTIIISLFSLLFIILFFVWLSSFLLMLWGAPFVPSPQQITNEIVSLANIKPGEKTVDLGSGDGRIVIALAQSGVEAHGYELNPFLVWWARYKIKRAGLRDKAFIHWKNFWSESLAPFDVIIIFGISYIMARLEKKLTHEAKEQARIISYAFSFPNWQPLQKRHDIYLYQHR